MFRRTDCHFCINGDEFDQLSDRYKPQHSDLINGRSGKVYLDTKRPRVCIRGPEQRGRDNLGYPWLAREDVFPFYELRSAALDLRVSKHRAWDIKLNCMTRI